MNIIKNNGKGLKDITVKDPKVIFTDLLKSSSGASLERTIRYSIFYQLIAFKGVKDGIGTSTIVANTALALAKLGLNVCVVDTSILAPCQDILLGTNYQRADKDEVVDWFDMGFTKKSVLNISGKDRRISVLSFQKRTLVDLLSTSDNESLVELAFSQLSTKFDIILIDVANEPSNISVACMQLAHKVIQVWSNSVPVMRSIESSIENNIICSCAIDKMKYVISSMIVEDAYSDWGTLLKKFHLKHLGHIPMSMEIAKRLALGQTLYNAAVNDASIQAFNDCITDVVCHILNITADTDVNMSEVTEKEIHEVNPVDVKEKVSDFPELGTYNDKTASESYMEAYQENDSDDLFDMPDIETSSMSGIDKGVLEKPVKRGLFRKGGKK